jgi:hypothetical protein
LPERLYQLVEPGLGHEFVALRVLPAGMEPRQTPRTKRRDAELSIEQLAWATRARLPGSEPSERPAVSRLAATLAAAARSLTSARRFSAGIDRRALERRLSAYRTMSSTSNRASGAAQTIERELALLDAVQDRAKSLDTAARRPSPSSTEIEHATMALDTAVAAARPALGKAAGRTRPTLRRGIRRLGEEYLVVTHDETGIERVTTFATMREARTFRLRRGSRMRRSATRGSPRCTLEPTACTTARAGSAAASAGAATAGPEAVDDFVGALAGREARTFRRAAMLAEQRAVGVADPGSG